MNNVYENITAEQARREIEALSEQLKVMAAYTDDSVDAIAEDRGGELCALWEAATYADEAVSYEPLTWTRLPLHARIPRKRNRHIS